jgi:hypothetical protein
MVTGLTASTPYSFSIIAKDPSGNTATNNPIVVNATTTENTNTACAGTDTQASEGSFTLGYNYNFSTSGTDVTVDFELLDAKDGLVAYAFTYNPDFAETGMPNVGGRKFSKTFTEQTTGATFKVACKFAFAGGLAVTKTFEYTVGDDCNITGTINTPVNNCEIFPNPVQNSLNIKSDETVSEVNILNIVGQTIKTITVNGTQKLIDLSDLSSGNYFVCIHKNNGIINTRKVVKL